MDEASFSNCSNIGSIWREWKPYKTSRILAGRPLRLRVAASDRNSPSSPLRTVIVSALWQATSIPVHGPGARSSLVSSTETPVASMPCAPEEQDCSINSARLWTSLKVFAAERTPVTQRAAYSPRLCPSTKVGLSPMSIQYRAKAISKATMAKCCCLAVAAVADCEPVIIPMKVARPCTSQSA